VIILKYFAGPIENVDTFLFAEGGDSAVGDLQSACLPRPPMARYPGWDTEAARLTGRPTGLEHWCLLRTWNGHETGA
jgi:hypothetical protein